MSLACFDKKILPRNTKNEFQVNSFHNQGITTSDLARDLIAFAKSGNIIEGFYHKNESIIGIQWHPERKNFEKSFDINLFRILFEKNIHSSFNL